LVSSNLYKSFKVGLRVLVSHCPLLVLKVS
jgi:hypothetical protein